VVALFEVVAEAVSAGAVLSSKQVVPQQLSSDFQRLRAEFGFAADDSVLARCFLLWAALTGAIGLEVFGQYGPDTLTEPSELFDLQIRLAIESLIDKP
jgi:hypothetical protein